MNEILDSMRTFDSCELAIIEKLFPVLDLYKYDQKISKINQDNFYLIKYYYCKMKKNFEFYCFTSKIKPKDEEKRLS